jgi:lactoylglutathione lyase
MRLEHVALWTRDLERARTFWVEHFGATAGARYASATHAGFTSYFVTLPGGGARLELMQRPTLADAPVHEAVGWAHVAVSLGSEAAVDAMTARLRAAGVPVRSDPRRTGDGYYEAVVLDPDGNHVELTA